MKKAFFFCSLFFALYSCGNSSEANPDDKNTNKPTAIDTTQHATGITNQNVISTDTAAMRVAPVRK